MKKLLIACLLVCLGAALFPRSVMLKMGPYYGYYSPNDNQIKDIYGSGSSIYGARLGITAWNMFSLWLNYAQYRVIAKTTFSQENTTLALNPLTVSVRITAPLRFFLLPYAALGLSFIDFKEEAAIGKIHDNGSGFAIDLGLEIRFSSHLSLDFNMRHNSVYVKPQGSAVSADIGGTQFGGSFVIAF